MRTLLPISEEQLRAGTRKHIAMVSDAKTPDELMLVLPYSKLLIEQAKAQDLRRVGEFVVDTFWDRHEELTYGGKQCQ